ncbi:ATP-dependent helicase SGS1 [Gracilariopsis chorda]|uniref:DNA 3'-5' helicase n=1 Tax=Gracilariopsis chorda TaxID=448386 RepID=A0A2V3IBG0_9FLOR|nr:ATP-dependent helicase SGS1 [Gracilariopsis chorda]|eukprot:PXF39443.1 ATP-dependent helicase SGS1 [Gracilariopsis chorda]
MLLYLSLFRPLESVIIDALYGSDVASVHANRLFVNNGEPFKEDRIRSCISQRLIFKETQLLFNDYRHFTAGMVPNVGFNQATGIMDEMQEELCNLGHLHACHTKSTAERAYARTREVLQDITHSTLHRYREWSKTWHRLLDLDKNCRPRLQTGPRIGNALDLEAQEKEMPSPPAKRSKLAVDSPRHGILASSVKAETPCSAPSSANDMVVLPSDISLNYHNIKRSQTQSTAENGVTLFNGDDRNYDHLIGTFLNDLRQMFQDQKATFRTYTQFRVTIAIAERQNNTLVIMPTGSGKTICVMLPVFIERSLKSIIIIVPLVSLSTEYVERATSCRLSVQTGLGRRNQSEFADIYIVLPEHVRDPRFRELVLRLTNQKRRARIVVDEAHLVSMWSSFRQSLRDIKYGLMCIPTSIPRVLLTATLPPRDRMNLLLQHRIRSAVLFKAPTVRRNLRFEVRSLKKIISETSRHPSGRFRSTIRDLLQALTTEMKLEMDGVCTNLLEYGNESKYSFRVLVYAMQRHIVEKAYEVLYASYVALPSGSTCNGELNYEKKISVIAYHAGMSENARMAAHKQWTSFSSTSNLTNDCMPVIDIGIMVCTSAFGAGVDAPNVRIVMHLGGSSSLVDYAQEAGRAGRDGLLARCVVLFSKRDADHLTSTLEKEATESFTEDAYRKLFGWLEARNWFQDSQSCRKHSLYAAMDGEGPAVCIFDPESEPCDVCLHHYNGPPRRAINAEPKTLGTQNLLETSQSPALDNSHKVTSHLFISEKNKKHANQDCIIQRTSKPEEAERESFAIADPCSWGSAVPTPSPPQSVELLIREAESVALDFEGDCLACLVLANKNIKDGHDCSLSRRRCFRCHSDRHRFSACRNFVPVAQGCCYKCGIGYCQGLKVHSQAMGFASTCKLVRLRDLGWLLWRCSEGTRRHIVRDLFCDNDSAAYHTNLTKLSTAGSQDNDRLWATWLSRTGDTVPNLLRLASWWRRKWKVRMDSQQKDI